MFRIDKKTIQLIQGKENVAQFLFSAAIVLELIVMMTDHMASWTLPYRGRVTHVAFLLLCAKILMSKYNNRQFIIIVLAGMLGTLSYFTCKDEYVLRAVVFVAATIGADTKRNLTIVFWGALVGTLVIVLLSILGVCGEVVDVRHYGRGMVEARYCLGFNHANNVHCMLWYIVSLLILLKYNVLRFTHYIGLFIVNLVLYFFTASRTGVLATAIILLMVIVNEKINRQIIKKIYLIIAYISFAMCIIISLRSAMVFPVGDKYQAKLNGLFTNRLEMVWEHMPMSTWMMFPGARTSEFVDNGFVAITYLYGTIVGVLLCTVIAYILYEAYKKDRLEIMIIALSSIFVVFMESTYIFNVSILCNILVLLEMEIINYA